MTSVSLQPTLNDVFSHLDVDFSFDVIKSKNQSNYNSAVEDFIIDKMSYSAGADMLWNNSFGFGLEGITENVGKGEVMVNGISSRIKLKSNNLSFRLSMTDLYVRQKSDFLILANTNIKDQLTLRNKRQAANLTWTGFESLVVTLSYSKYTYDTDVETLNLLLSAKSILDRNGAAFLSQIYSLIDYESRLDLIASLSDIWDFEFGFGESIDYLEPHIKSNDIRMGVTAYLKVFNVGAGVTAVKPTDSSDTLYSGDLRISYLF